VADLRIGFDFRRDDRFSPAGIKIAADGVSVDASVLLGQIGSICRFGRQITWSLIQDGERWRFAVGYPMSLRGFRLGTAAGLCEENEEDKETILALR